MSSSNTSTKPSLRWESDIPVHKTIQESPVHQLIIKKIQRPRPTLLRFSTVVTWLYFLQPIFETKNYSREKICRNCRLSLPNYVLCIHRLDQVYRSPVPECCLKEVTPYLPSKEPVLHYAGSRDHLSRISEIWNITRDNFEYLRRHHFNHILWASKQWIYFGGTISFSTQIFCVSTHPLSRTLW